MRHFVYALAIGTLAAAMSTPVFAQSANDNNNGSLPAHNGGMQSNESELETGTGGNPTNTNNGSLPAHNGGMQSDKSGTQTYSGGNPTNTNNGSLPPGNGGMQPNSSANPPQ
jgi:hypothetical protein